MDMMLRIPVDDPSAVGAARRSAMRLARRQELGDALSARAQLVATELATNVHRHARRGEILLRALGPCEGGGVEVIAVDRGPGIADVAAALRDGHSTAGTPGTGLGAVRRNSDVFEVQSTAGAGTAVVSRVRAAAAPESAADVGAVCLPMQGESVCGDAWGVAGTSAGFRVIVVDGLGHGPGAAQAAERAVSTFRAATELPVEEQLERVDRALRGTRGAALAIAAVDRAARSLAFCGAGNISGVLVLDGERRALASPPGTAGLAVRSLRPVEYRFPPGALLVVHSDGCRSGWSLQAHAGAIRRHPALVASLIWRDFARQRDDVTVVAVRERQVA